MAFLFAVPGPRPAWLVALVILLTLERASLYATLKAVGAPSGRLALGVVLQSVAVGLVAVVLGWALPQWLVGGLVLGFVGGFVYLVATMPRSGGDGWSGGDGAVV